MQSVAEPAEFPLDEAAELRGGVHLDDERLVDGLEERGHLRGGEGLEVGDAERLRAVAVGGQPVDGLLDGALMAAEGEDSVVGVLDGCVQRLVGGLAAVQLLADGPELPHPTVQLGDPVVGVLADVALGGVFVAGRQEPTALLAPERDDAVVGVLDGRVGRLVCRLAGVQLLADRLELPYAAVHLGDAVRRTLADVALRGVLVAGREESPARLTRNAARRNAAVVVRVVLEPLELPGGVVGGLGEVVLVQRRAEVRARLPVEERLLDGAEFAGELLVVQEDGGQLVVVGEFERRPGLLVGLLDVAGREHHAVGVALAGVEDVFEVRLLGFGGHAGRGPGAHRLDEDDRGLGDLRQPERLGHQREAAAAGAGHRLRAGVGRAERQRRRGDLVFDLLGDTADLGQVLGHQGEDLGPRRHGVAGDKAAAGVQRAVGDGVRAGQKHLLGVVAALGHPEVVGELHGLDPLGGRLEDLAVRRQDLPVHRVGHQVLDVAQVVLQQRAGRADAGGVPHDLPAHLAGHAAEVQRVDVPVVRLDAGLEVGDVLDVDESLVVDDDATLPEVVEVLGEGFDLLRAVVCVLLGVAGEGVAERQEEVVAVAPGPDRLGRRPHLDVGVAAPDPRGVVSVREDVESRPHQRLREVLAGRVDPVAGTARDPPHEFLVHDVSPRPLGRLPLSSAAVGKRVCDAFAWINHERAARTAVPWCVVSGSGVPEP